MGEGLQELTEKLGPQDQDFSSLEVSLVPGSSLLWVRGG